MRRRRKRQPANTGLVRSGRTQTEQRRKGGEAKRCRDEDDRSSHGVEQEAEQQRSKSLRRARRSAEQAGALAVAVRPEHRERNRAARDRQQAIASAVEDGERRRRRGPEDREHYGADRMQ